MQRISTLLALILCVIMAQAADLLSENFSSLTAKDYSGTVTLPSGEWTMSNMKVGSKNGSNVLQFNANGAYIISPAIDEPGSLALGFGSGGSKELDISYSVDGGEWVSIDTYKISGSGTFSYNKSTDLSETSNVRFKITATKGGNVWITSFVVSGSSTSGGGGGGDDDEPTNPDPQPEIEWTGPHSVEHCIYVAPWAPDDSGDGSWEYPYYNLQKAIDMAQPGDSIYVRGGTYYPSAWRDKMSDGTLLKTNKIRIEKNGDADHWFTIKTFPGEFPVLNFKDQPKGTNKSTTYGGIQLNGDYWHIYGLHITQAGDNGMKIEGSHNKIERCTFSYNDDTGLQLGFGHKFEASHPGISSNDGTYCAYNDIIDCDSYLNYDSDNRGSDADGFACKMHNGIGNRFIRCRAWHNADDAWDLFETDYGVKLIECWAWASAIKEDFTWGENINGGSFQGNGNGFKLGGNGDGGDSHGTHEAWFCIIFDCNKTGSVKGFDQNSHKDPIKLYGCLSFNNGYNYSIGSQGSEFYNNVSLGTIKSLGSNRTVNQMAVSGTESNNAAQVTGKGWSKDFVSTVSESDYVSLSENDAIAPRAADGSLPTRFARLKSTSVLIGKGKDLTNELKVAFPDIWQDFANRCGHDIGPYDYVASVPTGTQLILTNDKELSLCVAHGNLQFTVPANGKAVLDLYTPQGILAANVATILAAEGGQYSIPVPANLHKGVYVARLTFNGATRSVKFTVQ